MSTKPAKPEVDEDVARIARAIAGLRSRLKLTQREAAAGDRSDDGDKTGMSVQYWNMHETGKVPGIVKPATQRRLIEALNAGFAMKHGEAHNPGLTLADLEAELRNGEPAADDAAGRLARISRELAPRAAATDEAVFPTRDGPVVLQFPHGMSPAGFKDLEAYFAVFLRTRDGD